MGCEADERVISALDRIEARLGSLPEIERTVTRLEKALSAVRRGLTAPAGQQPRQESAVARVAVGGNEEEVWLDLPEERVASVMAPFANEQRVKLLKALYLGLSESGQLREFTGLTGGQLYHHLKELALAKFLSRQVRGEYHLSTFGYYAFSALMILAADLLAEEPEEELVKPEEIEFD
ncbi:MAG: hypothetical protein ACM3ZC_11075 [Bacteroidota bacterium]